MFEESVVAYRDGRASRVKLFVRESVLIFDECERLFFCLSHQLVVDCSLATQYMYLHDIAQ